MARSNYTEEVTKRVLEQIKQYRPEMSHRVKEASYGTKRPNDVELVAFYANQLKLEPPEVWELPDGTLTIADPMTADMQTGEIPGDRELLKRIESAVGKVMRG